MNRDARGRRGRRGVESRRVPRSRAAVNVHRNSECEQERDEHRGDEEIGFHLVIPAGGVGIWWPGPARHWK